MTPAGLTRTQRKALDFIRGYILEHGASPSFSDIACALGLSSKGNIHRIVQELAERGAITYRPRLPRSITITGGNTLTVTLPESLDVEVRALARRAGVTPEAVIIECVREHQLSIRSLLGSRETSLPLIRNGSLPSDT